jgi:lincosamide nucleotidyltransferase B/F
MNQNNKERLLQRLEAIGRSVAGTASGLALIGLGSVGIELDRLDAYSDLDFFVIVKPGYKQVYLDDLSWLASIGPIAYSFRNTADGYKLLYQDGIFCEFAVFEEEELADIPFAEGRIIWKAAGVDEAIGRPVCAVGQGEPRTVEWLLGEALTCLYVGLCRYHRGEKLSAQRFIQHYAVDRVLELVEMEQPTAVLPLRDPFAVERRYEQRFPGTAVALPAFIQGYERSCESARALLVFLDQHFAVNPDIKARILALSG